MSSVKDAAFGVWKAFATREPDIIREVLTEDARWVAPPRNATQVALGLATDMLETREGIVTFLSKDFGRLFLSVSDMSFTKVIAEGQTVVFEQRLRATITEGREYDNRYCWVFEMDGKRVREIREYMDTLAGQRMIFGDAPARQRGSRGARHQVHKRTTPLFSGLMLLTSISTRARTRAPAWIRSTASCLPIVNRKAWCTPLQT
ncbi:MAG: nuclear transport factor 2 family protein [Hyphomicrobiaceae bacterium]